MNSSYKNNRKRFFVRIILPAIISIILFVTSIFLIIIPSFESNIMERKREMIRELTNSAWSIMEKHQKDEADSICSREQAQQEAADEIRQLRYGDERKDYFWITDMQPNMIMHPYRTDLDGQSLSDFKDAHGKKLFVEFVDVVKKQQEGYVDYMWQWKDDSTRIVPKLSFVKEFKPWNWIIGTGIYTEDVKAEINKMESRVITISIVITLLIALLLAINMRQSMKIESNRRRAESDLKLSRERYRALVEASTEGSLMVLDNYIYANKTMLDLLGYDESEISKLNVYDIIADEHMKKGVPGFQELVSSLHNPKKFETKLRMKNGSVIDVMMNISKISLAEKDAVIIITKDLSGNLLAERDTERDRGKLKSITESLNIGLFRSILARKSTFIEANSATANILGLQSDEELFRTNIEDLFPDPDERRDFVKELISNGFVKNRILKILRKNNTIAYILASLFVVKETEQGIKYCDGIVEDITEKFLSEKSKESIMEKLQVSQSLIYQPIKDFVKQPVTCLIHTSIRQAASLMSKFNSDTILVKSDQDDILGIVADEDIRKRIVAQNVDIERPVFEIMNSPIVAVSENALLYEAMFMLRDAKIKHLAVKDMTGRIKNIISSDELLCIQNHAPEVLIKQIHIAASVDELEMIQKELKLMVKNAVDSGSNPKQITRIISSFSETLIEKLNILAIEELGTPPVAYSFISLGSVGREEQTLATDQDNAIIYEDVAADLEQEVNAYFKKLGNKICTWLDQIGYCYCKGNIMAMNPKFCKPLSAWKDYFSEWVTTNEPQDLLEVNIFFDFRSSFGSTELALNLKEHLNMVIENNSVFFYHLAVNTLSIKPPLSFFGNIIKESKDEHVNIFDIKKAIMPIVGFARVYALKNKIGDCNTIDRIENLHGINVIRGSEYSKMVQMYDYLMRLRFRHQVDQMTEGKQPDNYINPNKLTELDQAILKKIFSLTGTLQTRLSYDFKGTAM